MQATRTWLCPNCEGWGVIELNDGNPFGYGPDPQDDHDVDCAACDGSGVIVASYAEGDDKGLIPWDGLTGKVVEGVRAAKREPDILIRLADRRIRKVKNDPFRDDFLYRAYRARAYRKCSGFAQEAA
jgi:hypothetical protein